MTIPTVGIDENSPAGGDSIKQGDNRIRELKTQFREIIEVNHVCPSSGQDADAGKHKKVSLIELADIGSGASGKPILGAQTVSGKPELVYTDEDDNDIQLTTNGKLSVSSLTTVASISTILNLIYPIGFVVTLGVSTNPATLFGIGTWTAIAGKVIVGIDATQTEFDTLDETGGSKTNSHTHTVTGTNTVAGTHRSDTAAAASNGGLDSGGFVQAQTFSGTSGAPSDTSNLQPYIVKYVWQRTA